MPEENDKLYRTLSVRLNASEFEKFEKIKELLQKKTKSAGVYSTVKNPDVLKHLITQFFELEKK